MKEDEDGGGGEKHAPADTPPVQLRFGFEEVCAAIIVAVLFTVLASQIVLRALGAPLVWAEEFSTIAFVSLVFAGAGAALRRREHLDVDLFQKFALRHLGARVARLWDGGVVVAQFLFLGIFAIGLISMTRLAWTLNAGTLPGFRYGWLYLAVLGFAAVALVRLTLHLIDIARRDGR